MIFPLVAALVLTLPTLVLGGLFGLGRLWWKWPRRYWATFAWANAALFVLHLFVTFPLAVGYLGSRLLRTRPQERTYAGPRLDAAGHVLVQSWESLAREQAAGKPEVEPAIVDAAAARRRTIPSSDGVQLRAFRLEAPDDHPRAVVVLVHGLFRSAMELEPIAAMLHERGCECWLMELRNHGGSSSAPFTGGLREAADVVAVVQHVRAQPGRADLPVAVFAISLGTIAVSLALPRLDGLAGVALEAPIDDLHGAVERWMAFHRVGDRRTFFALSEPWRTLVMRSLEWWSDFRIDDVCPSEVLAHLPHDLPFLMIADGDDDRAPQPTVEAMFARLPMPPELRRLWLVPGAHHGQAVQTAPQPYAEHLEWLLAHLRRR